MIAQMRSWKDLGCKKLCTIAETSLSPLLGAQTSVIILYLIQCMDPHRSQRNHWILQSRWDCSLVVACPPSNRDPRGLSG